MAYTVSFLPTNTASSKVRIYIVADTAAELPTTSPVAEGDLAYAKDTDALYTFDGAAWQAIGGGSGLTAAKVMMRTIGGI